MIEDADRPQDLGAVPWPVRTQRLTIRPATTADLSGLFEIRRRPEVAEWLPTLPTDAEEFARRQGDPRRLAVTLVMEMDDALVGDLYLHIGTPWSQDEVKADAVATQAEIGWALSPEFAGRGLATEAAAELLRICFDDLGLRRVTASSFADNVASWRIMEKIGMRRESYTRAEALHRSGRWLDGVGYAILADEWRSR